MMSLIVRLVRIDPYGFNGRDHPPSKNMEGLLGVVTNLDLIPDEEMETPNEFAPWLHQKSMQWFNVVMETGQMVELLGHEIELVSATHNGDL